MVVNEVLANEPGGATSLEWIELYNGSASPIPLDGYTLQIGDNLIPLPEIELLDGEYYIICRRLFATESSPGFESIWGDSSGVWGDTPFESSIPTPFETGFSLKNDSGRVALTLNGEVVSALVWTESGTDGHSWERILPSDDRISQSVDPSGSTPGIINSLTPVPYDLALALADIRSVAGSTGLVFTVKNTGQQPVGSASLFIIDRAFGSDTIDVISLDEISPGDSLEVSREYLLDGVYVPMSAALSDDDRDRNNTLEFIAPGTAFPPVILSELLANPQGDLNSEWVEISNRSGEPVNLAQWMLGDALHSIVISPDTLYLMPDKYLVLVQTEPAFLAYYAGLAAPCMEPAGWPALNNDGDIVRLVDSYGLQADSFSYSFAYDDNYTWSRNDTESWGRSEDPDGTPGATNEVLLEHRASWLSVSADPPYISPDGDGLEDIAVINISAPLADSYTVRIYDRQGRVVKTIYQDESMIPSTIEWNGLSDAGRRLPIGLYIIYVEACGVSSAKTPIVIAR
ncbi:MAG: lamin tail domain-containing protein [Candidatus Zixiibacteriota bacterium]|nr:MAG: lamin tail domain-containing protein [candidate division Zixibacteria bacterium]